MLMPARDVYMARSKDVFVFFNKKGGVSKTSALALSRGLSSQMALTHKLSDSTMQHCESMLRCAPHLVTARPTPYLTNAKGTTRSD